MYYDLLKARNEKNLDKDIAIARVEQVQIILFCSKIHLFGLFKYSSFISLMVRDLLALANILPSFYKEISLMVLLYPCVCPLSKRKFHTTLTRIPQYRFFRFWSIGQMFIGLTPVDYLQISPFPYDLVKKECAKYPNAVLCWAQEEAKNQGAWTYVQPRFNTTLNASRNIR